MAYEVEFTDEFEGFWNELTEDQQDAVAFVVGLLTEKGPMLGRPYVDTLYGSKFPNMKELRVRTSPAIRILFAFDPRQTGLLLLGGFKTGKTVWYETTIAKADRIYAEHLESLRE